MIRRAVPDDLPAIVALGLEALERGAYPELVISRAKVEALARQCVSAARNFSWVAEKDGEVGGALCAIVSPLPFHERDQAVVIQFYSRIPGDGIALIRAFLRWTRGRPGIKLTQFTLETDADPRIAKLLVRLGVSHEHPVLVQVR